MLEFFDTDKAYNDSEHLNSLLVKSGIKTFKQVESDGVTFVLNRNDHTYEKVIADNATYFRKLLLGTPFYRAKSFHVKNDFWNVGEDVLNDRDGNLLSKIRILTKRISKEANTALCRWHVYSENISTYIDILNGLNTVFLNVIVYDTEGQSVEEYMWAVERSSEEIHVAKACMMSLRQDTIKNRVFAMNMSGGAPAHIVAQVVNCLRLMKADKTEYPESGWLTHPHSNLEWRFVVDCAHHVYGKSQTVQFEVGGIGSDGKSLIELYGPRNVNSEIIDRIELTPSEVSNLRKKAPVVICSVKEWNHILSYAHKKGIFEKDADPVDLSAVFKQNTYGNTFMLDTKCIGSYGYEGSPVFIHYNYNEEEDILSLVIEYDIMERCRLHTIVVAKSIKQFKMEDVFDAIWQTVLVDQSGNHPVYAEMLEALSKYVPDSLWIPSEAFCQFLSLLVIMRDRPEKMRTITETKKSSEEKKERTEKEKKKPKEKQTSDIVVRHILMPAKSAKQYVAEMSGDSTREYVLESWNRRAHTRTLKNGKVIYIGETECHRKLPLTENKKMYIKL